MFKFIQNKKEEKSDSNVMYDSFMNNIQKMKNAGISDIILTIYETNPQGGFNTDFDGSQETELNQEIELRNEKRSYDIVKLISIEGIEGIKRTNKSYLNALLPGNLGEKQYHTKEWIVIGENLKNYARNQIDAGWTPELIDNVVDDQLNDWRGVSEKLKEMNKREYSPFEQIINEMRNNIYKR